MFSCFGLLGTLIATTLGQTLFPDALYGCTCFCTRVSLALRSAASSAEPESSAAVSAASALLQGTQGARSDVKAGATRALAHTLSYRKTVPYSSETFSLLPLRSFLVGKPCKIR